MLFLNIEKYGASFHVYGELRGEVNTEFRSSSTLNENFRVDLQRFDKLAPMHGEKFEFAEIYGFKLYSFLDVSQKILTTESCRGGYDMAHLVIFHQNLKIEMPFEEWIGLVPGLLRGRGGKRTNLSIFRTYEGEYVLFYIQDGKVNHRPLEGACFIKDGEVVTLEQVIQNRRAQVAEYQRQVEQKIERLTTQSFRLSEELHGSEFLNQCVWNPR